MIQPNLKADTFAPEPVPLAPNGTPIGNVGNINNVIAGGAQAAANAARDRAIAEAAALLEQKQKEQGRLIMYAIAGVIGFFVLRNMRVI